MLKPTLKSCLPSVLSALLGAIALSLTVSPTPVQAFSISYDFTVTVPTGTYAGVHRGSFTYDDAGLTGKGGEAVSPGKGSLSVLFNFLNAQFTHVQDRDFQFDFPRISFQDGQLLGLDFLVISNPSVANFPGFRIVSQNDPRGISAGFHVGVTSSLEENLVGTVVYALRTGGSSSGGPGNGNGNGSSGDPVAVPEPSEIAGSFVALGLVATAIRYRRKATSIS